MTTGYRPEIIQRAFVDFIGTRLHPFWSLTTPKLRLLARQALSDDLIALQFEGNRAFRQQVFKSQNGWQGGQHINISVPIEGINHQRHYSLVGLADEPLWWQNNMTDTEHNSSNNHANKNPLNKKQHHQKQQRHTITIAIKPQGLVSHYLTKQAPLGTIFDSGVPSGDFTLAHPDLVKKMDSTTSSNSSSEVLFNNTLSDNILSDNKLPALLFVAGGSGITPMLGLVTQALQRGHQVTLLHYNRLPLTDKPEAVARFPLQDHWQQLATKYSTFNYHLINTDDPSTYLADSRHLNAQSLLALDLPLATAQIFACGSPSLLAGLYRAADDIDLPADNAFIDSNSLPDSSSNLLRNSLRNNIIIENFGNVLADLASADLDSNGIDKEAENREPQTVTLRARQRQFTSSNTLLIDAEQAGLRLNYGCRQGICQLCRCNKISGRVKNIQTGKISSDGLESIQTCINIAMTDIVLDI